MTYRELLYTIENKLEAANVPDSKTDAWRLFEDFSGISRAAFILKKAEEVEDEKLEPLLLEKADLRAQRVPLQYITGRQEFYGLTMEVSRDTLIPRFDTELLAEEVVKAAKNKAVLDLCTGTGCIILSVAKFGAPSVAVGTDLSEGAVELAKRNAVNNGITNVDFYFGDLFEALKGTEFENKRFDIIVSNPPYVTPEEMKQLEPEVKDYEPKTALLGGSDGLEFYRKITGAAEVYLAENGLLMYEIGCSQGESVAQIMKENGFVGVEIKQDFGGLNRIVIGRKGKE